MNRHATRRSIIVAGSLYMLAGCTTPVGEHNSTASSSPRNSPPHYEQPKLLNLTDLPAGDYGVWGTLRNRVVYHNSNSRFRMCSTMKFPLVALVLHLRQRGKIDLNSMVSWNESDFIGYSPFTSQQADNAATVSQLCEATARTSDNTATNSLLDAVGGLRALEAFVGSLGDKASRFDRRETEMNIQKGELDTTTAEAFGRLALAIPDGLRENDRRTFFSWLPARDKRRIAAATPSGLNLHHKTGTSGDGALNDVAVLSIGQQVTGSLAIFTDSESPQEEVVVEIARRAFNSLID
jgi:beta-lactamase class A